jgi:hypothetical protein
MAPILSGHADAVNPTRHDASHPFSRDSPEAATAARDVASAAREHLLRAASAIANEREFVVIGSQAILGQYPDAPASLLTRPMPWRAT